jgi:hypothetical protein
MDIATAPDNQTLPRLHDLPQIPTAERLLCCLLGMIVDADEILTLLQSPDASRYRPLERRMRQIASQLDDMTRQLAN